jgi:hypothetical protein
VAAEWKKSEAVIRSMTPGERRNPDILNAGRRRRIAAGSGTTVQDVNAVLQMLAHVGKTNIDDDLIRRCAATLDDHDLKILKKSHALMPGWMSDAVLKIGMAKYG